MATLGKPARSRKRRLGAPPAVDDVSDTLDAPEVAPVAPEKKARRKTGRVVPFNTKVTTEFDEAFREVAFRSKRKHAELLEDMLALYQEHAQKDK